MSKAQQGNDGVLHEYTAEQRSALEKHIEQYFGPISFVLSQTTNKDICLDIAVIEPSTSRKRNFYTLVTMGLGAYKAPAPKALDKSSEFDFEEEEQASYNNQVDRCELVMMLNSNFKIPSADENHYWPIRLLKEIAHLPFDRGTFIDWGVCYTQNKPFAPKTKLSHCVLCGLNKIFEVNSQAVSLPNGFDVGFYSVLPLYLEEYLLLLKTANLNPLKPLTSPIPNEYLNIFIDKMRFIEPLVNNDRTSGAQDLADYWSMISEDMRWHMMTIEQKNLDVDPINTLNHMAILLRYMIEKKMVSSYFVKLYSDEIQDVLTGKAEGDLRYIIRDHLNGVIDRRFFNHQGMAFLNQYLHIDIETAPRYTYDIESYTLRYFGIEKYYSKQFDTEGYLFVPYTPMYYEAMKKLMDSRLAACAEQKSQVSYIDEQTSIALQSYLGCKTCFFPKLLNDTPIKAKLNYSYLIGCTEGYIPVVIEVQQYLLEMAINILDNINPTFTNLEKIRNEHMYSEDNVITHNIDYAYAKRFGTTSMFLFDRNKVQAVRYNCMNTQDIKSGSSLTIERLYGLLDAGLINRKTVSDYEELSSQFRRELTEAVEKREKQHLNLVKNNCERLGILNSVNAYERAHICLGPLDKAESFNLYSYWDENTNYTKPVLLAHIPVDDVAMILPYLAFLYPSDENLDPLEVVMLVKHFWDSYLAIPAVITLSGIEFITCKPLTKLQAQMLAYDILVLGDYLIKEDVPRSLPHTIPAMAQLLENQNSFFFPIITPRQSDVGFLIDDEI